MAAEAWYLEEACLESVTCVVTWLYDSGASLFAEDRVSGDFLNCHEHREPRGCASTFVANDTKNTSAY